MPGKAEEALQKKSLALYQEGRINAHALGTF
jgi:hypothetical protein